MTIETAKDRSELAAALHEMLDGFSAAGVRFKASADHQSKPSPPTGPTPE